MDSIVFFFNFKLRSLQSVPFLPGGQWHTKWFSELTQVDPWAQGELAHESCMSSHIDPKHNFQIQFQFIMINVIDQFDWELHQLK